MSGGEDIPTNTINDTWDVGIKESDLCFNLVRAGKNEATNGARMGNIKIKMEFSLAQCLCMAAGCHGNGEKIKRTSLSLSLSGTTTKHKLWWTARWEPNPKRKKIRASIEGSWIDWETISLLGSWIHHTIPRHRNRTQANHKAESRASIRLRGAQMLCTEF
jgi:hypothetical protein